ncbi:glycerol-3-phosphate 1-O-acyltransferase PlsY [uncultured Enterovirga sp.]|uniref:glycerol-3-phosphate 1-O-acyltransferase PlsY n=1 Tax=uncultured Enterovirga sp. TaxID=2026352 RepID=UPI0035CB5AEA
MTLSFWPAILGGLALGYLLGAIPFGLILTRMAGLGDVRAIGSGNIGATNVLRTGHKGLAASTLLLDALKATAAIVLADRLLGPEAGLAAALGAILGHCFPVWLGFRGGKGVATFIGCLLGLDSRLVLIFATIWLAVAAVTRYSSLAGLLASLGPPAAAWWLGHGQAAVVLGLILPVLWAKHHANIERLLAGTESRIGRKA